ncbi:putative fad dependent oxidoreductase [Moniliophthora roreri MCA 2997]|uniref:Fad dependent oxidoreductase n=2 Tax=Moniliophthora roreri TaxID=221103 RepID=V2XQF4_MONRO|nr:putative fad dependent oxidoreductase [Moniliophthora roreri MCA 2997]KAI3608975.1 putative fad dependent oxidoreductase [Moniliophthora roreri]
MITSKVIIVAIALLLNAETAFGTTTAACDALQSALPGRVFFPGSEEYVNDIDHYTQSLSQNSACSVEPESVDDLRIVADGDTRSAFAVKGGGHTGNVGFSSTTGVQISMSRFSMVEYEADTSTVRIGAGQIWSDVYALLAPQGVKVVGGRVPGVGVGGLALGGGYSYFTDQYGLAIDTIVAHDLVLPNGTFIKVTNETDPDLFFALKGGFNNFGIVTSFTMQAFPQTDVWAAQLIYPMNASRTVHQAIDDWSAYNTDVKANALFEYSASGLSETSILARLFYDGPVLPNGIFDEFFDIPGSTIDAAGTMSVPDAMEALYADLAALNPQRTARHTVSNSRYTIGILDEMKAQFDRIFSAAVAENRSLVAIAFAPEPFAQPNVRSTDSAYPHPPGRFVCPTPLEIDWTDPADDEFFFTAINEAQRAIQAKTVEEGQGLWDDILYNNYAPADTPLELLYGNNLERLREIKKRVDPEDVMGLAGGFKIE